MGVAGSDERGSFSPLAPISKEVVSSSSFSPSAPIPSGGFIGSLSFSPSSTIPSSKSPTTKKKELKSLEDGSDNRELLHSNYPPDAMIANGLATVNLFPSKAMIRDGVPTIDPSDLPSHATIRDGLATVDPSMAPQSELKASQSELKDNGQSAPRKTSEAYTEEQFELDVHRINPSPYETQRIEAKKLGQGGIGFVYKASYRGFDVAVKVLRPDWNRKKVFKNHLVKPFLRECDIMTKLNYPHVARLYGYSANSRCLIMELAELGSLHNILEDKKNYPRISWLDRLQIAKDVALGLWYLHAKKILHRDLKSFNIMLRQNWRAFLADFGIAKIITPQAKEETKLSGYVGSYPWMPPEMLRPSEHRNQETVDIYSFGMVLYELLTRHYPFQIEKFAVDQIIKVIASGGRPFLPTDSLEYDSILGVREEYLKLLKDCWSEKPENRPTLPAILNRLEPLLEVESIMEIFYSVVPSINLTQTILDYLLVTEASTENLEPTLLFEKCHDAAALNISWAQLKLAHLYRQGIGTKKSHEKAFQYYELASNNENNLEAAMWVAFYYLHDLSIYKNNYEKAFHLSKKGFENKIPLSYSNLGFCYQLGKGVEQIDLKRAICYYKEGVKLDEPYAQSYLGQCYQMGYGVEIDFKEAKRLYILGIEQNCSLARWSLGDCYEREKNLEGAVKQYQIAAEQGETLAQSDLGRCYQFGQGISPDIKKAIYWYQIAATEGKNARSQYRLGYCYEKGLGDLKVDFPKAFSLYLLSAEQGYPHAQCDVGRCYQEGLGVSQDNSKALFYYHRAALQQNSRARYHLGRCYENGLGSDTNSELAFFYYSLAADQNLASAQYELGRCYQKGLLGQPIDEKKAFEYYLAAAKQNYDNALLTVAQCYQFGYGIKENLAESQFYFQSYKELRSPKSNLDRLKSPEKSVDPWLP